VQGLSVVMGLAAVALVVFGLLPLGLVLARGVVVGGEVDAGPLWASWSAGRTWELLGSSALMAGLSSGLTVLLGAPAAWLLARVALPGREALKTALTLPYVIPPYILAMGWITLFNPGSGWLNGLLGGGGVNIYSLGGMVWVLGLAYFPLVLLQVYAALMGMDPSLEEAARTSGAGPWRVVWTVTLPLALPSIGSGALLTFLVSLASFGVPYLVGSPGRVEVLTTAIYTSLDLGTEAGVARAVGLAVLLCGVAAAALGLNGALVRRGRALVGGKAGRPSLVELGRWRWVAWGGLWGLVGVAVVLPLGTVVLTSLVEVWGSGLSWGNLGWGSYRAVLSDARALDAAWRSLWLGGLAATVCVALGALASYARRRTTLVGRRALPFLAELPYAVPGTVLAMGMILAFSQEVWIYIEDVFYLRFFIFNSPWILLIAYSAKYMAFGVRTSDAALTQVDVSLEEAARTSGAGPLRVLLGIVAPLLRPALVAAWVLVFLPVLGEITLSILLFGPETKTLGVLLFDLQTYESPPRAAVLGTLLVGVVLVGNLGVKRLSGGRLGL
jgi:iron(III) transport system permease protein